MELIALIFYHCATNLNSLKHLLFQFLQVRNLSTEFSSSLLRITYGFKQGICSSWVWVHLQFHSGYWPNLVLCCYITKAPIFLISATDNNELPGCPHVFVIWSSSHHTSACSFRSLGEHFSDIAPFEAISQFCKFYLLNITRTLFISFSFLL